jgi:lipoprotein-anchoring transpeptidase ErfK/SrfK
MIRIALFTIVLWLLTSVSASAQPRPSWAEEAFGGPRAFGHERPVPPLENVPDLAPALVEGGPRPQIIPEAPPVVAFAYNYPAASIVIDISARKLYYVVDVNAAYEYSISVGREGFNWSGTETISRKQAWPDWYPPQEMRQRDPSLPKRMTGGIRNPLGVMALYLGTTLYRIHGTNDERSIGQAQSSGCFRMRNAAVLHLAEIVQPGTTTVTVVNSLQDRKEVSQAS